jgi:hypothetical protein
MKALAHTSNSVCTRTTFIRCFCYGFVYRLLCHHPVPEGAECDSPVQFNTENIPLEMSHAASLSSLHVGEDDEECSSGKNSLLESVSHFERS